MNEKPSAPLVPVVLDAARCIDCGRCLDACPTGVFQRPDPGLKPVALFARDCHVCFLCQDDCPVGAIKVDYRIKNPRTFSIYDLLDIPLDGAPPPKIP